MARKLNTLTSKQANTLLWWLITFQYRKLTAYYYWEEVMGMLDHFAVERAKDVTKSEYRFMRDKVKDHQKKLGKL